MICLSEQHEVLEIEERFIVRTQRVGEAERRGAVLGNPDEELQEYSCSENNVDRDHLGFGPGPIRKDGTRGYEDPAPLPPPLSVPVKK